MQLRDGGCDPVAAADGRIAAVLGHPATSRWLEDSLARALDRDPVDAVDDAEALLNLLGGRAEAILDTHVAG